MKWSLRYFGNSVLLIFLAFSLLLPVPAASGDCDPSVATAVSVQGTVEAKPAGGSQWQPVKLNDTFCPGDEIRVLDNSRASLALANEWRALHLARDLRGTPVYV